MQLKINDLSVSYGKKEILKNITFTMEPGIYGVLGENGAGKTTLFRTILGLKKHKGTIEFSEDICKNIGYIPQQFDTLHWLTTEEVLRYFACLKDIPKNQQKELVKSILERVNLVQESDKMVQALSGGMKRRLGIAQALIDNPALLLMDEPMVGLDPYERMNFRNVIQEIKNERIIMISSHEIRELEGMCEQILFVHKGELCAHDTLENLYKKYGCTDLEQLYFQIISS